MELSKWQGSQICGIGFDELTHFSRKAFIYMLSRNRSTCGVRPFVRATCNPDADSWVADFISWWINQETGYAIPERSGAVRWMLNRDDTFYWADTPEELWEQFDLKTEEERQEPKSVTFIMSSVYDNKELLKINPGYLANLKALPTVEKERLLHGNWKIRPAAGLYFKKSQVGNYLNVVPDDVIKWVRCWDLAATAEGENEDSAHTAGVLIGKRKNGRYVIADVIDIQQSASDVRNTIKHTCQMDRAKYKRVTTRLPKDPGQAGKDQAQSYIKFLSGFTVKTVAETGSKEARAEPMAAQWQAGNFDVVIADWNDKYLTQLENFPDGKLKDITGLYGLNVWADMCGTESVIFNQEAMDKKQLEDIAALQEQEIRKLRSFLDAAVRANQICKFCALDGEENSKSCIIHEGSCGGFFDSRLAKAPNVIE